MSNLSPVIACFKFRTTSSLWLEDKDKGIGIQSIPLSYEIHILLILKHFPLFQVKSRFLPAGCITKIHL
jgi:hypothetical protein